MSKRQSQPPTPESSTPSNALSKEARRRVVRQVAHLVQSGELRRKGHEAEDSLRQRAALVKNPKAGLVQ